MKSRTRPSSGCALRREGNEIAKRSGPASAALPARAPHPRTASSSAAPGRIVERMASLMESASFPVGQRAYEKIRQVGGRRPIERFVHADGEQIALGCGEHHAELPEPFLECDRIRASNLKAEQVRTRWNTVDRERAMPAQAADHVFRRSYGPAVAIAEAREMMERDGGERPGAGESSAEHASRMIHAVDDVARPSQNRAGGGIEILVERHVHGVEWPRSGGHVLAGAGRLQKQARAVQVEPDAFAPRQRDDRLQFCGAEGLALLPPYRRLD